ncbi:MAG TPA: energy transducer TonB [Candidatus Hypogeohydataceae bacterium YC41]
MKGLITAVCFLTVLILPHSVLAVEEGEEEAFFEAMASGLEDDALSKGIVSARIEGTGRPEYPRECLLRGHEGRVVVEITILADGKSGGVTVIETSGCEKMEQSVLRFLEKCRLIPKTVLGKPVDSSKKIAFNFEIFEPGSLKSFKKNE